MSYSRRISLMNVDSRYAYLKKICSRVKRTQAIKIDLRKIGIIVNFQISTKPGPIEKDNPVIIVRTKKMK